MPDSIIKSFDTLIASIEAQRDNISTQIARHADKDQFDAVITLGKQADAIDELRNQVIRLRQEWRNTYGATTATTSFSNLERGIRTPQHAYYLPILEALIELGGTAEPKEILPRVYSKVRHILTDYDHEQLLSNPRKIRWRTATRFASHELRVQGLLANSPYGIWEISPAGRQHVADSNTSSR